MVRLESSLQGHIILSPNLLKLFLALIILINSSNSLAKRNQESFEFSLGDNVHIISDKAFRKTKDNIFEAIGNVIITHQNNAIYCEKASLNFQTGQVLTIGNVRYIGNLMTMYGSKIEYNLKSGEFIAENARILGNDYIVIGKKLTRLENGTIYGEDAEYTTCRDCPESWSVFGRRIHVTLNEYIQLNHAFIKIKGVISAYIPYIVFPIKKNREMGLLFPKLGYDFEEGFHYKQPWFLPLGESADITLTPSLLGRRGLGSEVQARQILKEGLWYEVNSMQVFDQVYQPSRDNKNESGSTELRTLNDWEHHFFSGKNINHHFFVNGANDLDIADDLQQYIDDRHTEIDYGGRSFLDLRHDWFSLSTQGSFMRNGLYEDPKGFDHRYVQVLPKTSFETIPIHLFHSRSRFLSKSVLNLKGDFSAFRQNHKLEGEYIRNAYRYNGTPSLELDLFNIGPFNLKTTGTMDYQHYRFPYEEKQKSFTKSGIIYETEFSFALEKIIGLAFNDRVIPEQKSNSKKEELKQESLIGSIDAISPYNQDQQVIVKRKGYRHRQEFKFKHHFLTDQSIQGNRKFNSQIQDEGKGRFDDIDAIRDKQTELDSSRSNGVLPLTNTLELQWNNTLVSKKSKSGNLLIDGKSIRENFEYARVGHFNLSQGVYRFRDDNGVPHHLLTRLTIDSGMQFYSMYLNFKETYFHYTHEHDFRSYLMKRFDHVDFTLGVSYNSFNIPVNKKFNSGIEVRLNDYYKVVAEAEYDYEKQRIESTQYKLYYKPPNNCWKLNLTFRDSVQQKGAIALNFAVNYNGDKFASTGD